MKMILAMGCGYVYLSAIPAFYPNIVLCRVSPSLSVQGQLVLVPIPLYCFRTFIVNRVRRGVRLVIGIMRSSSSKPNRTGV